jgi:hypothetical protein
VDFGQQPANKLQAKKPPLGRQMVQISVSSQRTKNDECGVYANGVGAREQITGKKNPAG